MSHEIDDEAPVPVHGVKYIESGLHPVLDTECWHGQFPCPAVVERPTLSTG